MTNQKTTTIEATREEVEDIFHTVNAEEEFLHFAIEDILQLIEQEKRALLEDLLSFGAEWRAKLNNAKNDQITEQIIGMEKGILYYQQKIQKLAHSQEDDKNL